MERDVPPIPPYSMTSGCSATLAGNAPIDYFSLFVDDCMLQHIVDQTILNSKHFMESHTLGQRSRIRQWLKEEHTIAELRRFLALIIIMGIVRYPQIESHWSTSWPYATDAFSSVSSFLYKHVHRIEKVLLSTGHDKRLILPTDEIPFISMTTASTRRRESRAMIPCTSYGRLLLHSSHTCSHHTPSTGKYLLMSR